MSKCTRSCHSGRKTSVGPCSERCLLAPRARARERRSFSCSDTVGARLGIFAQASCSVGTGRKSSSSDRSRAASGRRKGRSMRWFHLEDCLMATVIQIVPKVRKIREVTEAVLWRGQGAILSGREKVYWIPVLRCLQSIFCVILQRVVVKVSCNPTGFSDAVSLVLS